MPANLAIVFGKKCGVKADEIDPAIERAAKFFGYFVDKGTIPYGNDFAGRVLSASQTFTFWSAATETTNLPSGENATAGRDQTLVKIDSLSTPVLSANEPCSIRIDRRMLK